MLPPTRVKSVLLMSAVFCAGCDARIPDPTALPPAPCALCGSWDRRIDVEAQGTTTARELVTLKQWRGQKRGSPHLEMKTGDSLHHDTDEWHRLFQVIDRENNRYRKLVVNPTTNEVVRDVEEPLDQHQGYGDAKRRTEQ